MQLTRWLTLLLLLPGQAAAQGVLRGTVRDEQGTAIGAAVVGIPGTTLYTQSDQAGRYRLAPLPAGTLTVRAAAIGYAPATAVVTAAERDSVVQDFVLRESPLELTPLDVVSTKVPRFGERPATSVTQVSERELDLRAVYTVDEAIDKEPGIQFLNGQINIRGSTGYVQGLNSRVLLLVDGVPMNQGDRGGINWDIIPADQVEQVDVLKGAGSSLYGSAALGGVVNLTTRDIPEGWQARLRLTGGAFDDPPHPVWQFRDATGLQGGGDVSASYGTSTLGGRIAAGARHSDGYREQDERDHWQVAAKTRWQAAPRTRVDVSGSWAVDRYEVPLTWCNQGECDDQGQAYQPFKIDTADLGARTDSRKGYLAAQVRTLVSERLAWQARASWLRTDFTDFRRSGGEFSVSNRFGGEARIEAHPDSARTVLVGAEGTFSDVSSDIFGTHSQSEFAAYGEGEQPVGTLRVHAGARLDFLAVDGGSLTAVVSPRIAVTIKNFRGSIGRGFRAPSVAERFLSGAAAGFPFLPNPNLQPETAWSFELGHTTAPLWQFMRIDAALFWTEARDYIEPQLVQDNTGAPAIQFQNLVRARIVGLDASVLAAPIPNRLRSTLGYTYLSTKRQVEGAAGTGSEPLAFRPPHLLILSADYTPGGFDVGMDLRYSSRPEKIELEGFVDPRRVPMKVLDLRASWRSGPVELRLLLANALNYIYNLVPETLAPVRTLTLTALWSR